MIGIQEARPARDRPWPVTGLRLVRLLMYWGLVLVFLALVSALAVAIVPRVLGFTTYVVYGGSMGDALPTGSVAIAGWTRATDVRRGDIVVVGTDVEGQRLPIAHRVTSVRPLRDQRIIQTKGDTNATADAQPFIVPDADRVMKVGFVVPLAGYAVHFIRTPLGWALAVMVPATLLCVFTVWGIWWPRSQPRQSLGTQRWTG